MENTKCYYIVKARTALKNSITDAIEFKAIERKFEDSNPIVARKEAFKFRNEFIYGMLIGIGLGDKEIGWDSKNRKIENLTDRQIRKLLNPYFENVSESSITKIRLSNGEEEEIEWEAPDDSLAWYTSYNNGIWVLMVHDDNEIRWDDESAEIVIDKMCRYEYLLPIPPLYQNLEEEFKFYEKHNYQIEDFKTNILFFDDEEFLNEEITETDALKSVTILKTPFDWTLYDKKYWWINESDTINSKSENEKQLPTTIHEAFNKGEHEFAEFKPGLLNKPEFNRDLECEIAQTLCAFLNSKGGYLFIGVNNQGKVYSDGLKVEDKDKFLRDFTRIKTQHLPQFIAHTIYGDFYFLNQKLIFVITVFPSLIYPIFFRKKDPEGKIVKEFYVRSDAASRHMFDIEELVKYCRNHWE